MTFGFERLPVYRLSLKAASEMVRLSPCIPARWGDLRHQLLKAAASIPLNVAEGAAEFSPADKARFYRFARRSAAECKAILELSRELEFIDENYLTAISKSLDEIGAMLTGLVKSLDTRDPRRADRYRP